MTVGEDESPDDGSFSPTGVGVMPCAGARSKLSRRTSSSVATRTALLSIS